MSEEETDRLLEEEFFREAGLLERSLFAGDEENSFVKNQTNAETEAEEAYKRLVKTLQDTGIYRVEAAETIGSRRTHRIIKAAVAAAVCILGMLAAGMVMETDRSYFAGIIECAENNTHGNMEHQRDFFI